MLMKPVPRYARPQDRHLSYVLTLAAPNNKKGVLPEVKFSAIRITGGKL